MSKVALADLLNRLERVRPTEGGFIARCPAHTDKNPSFTIAQTPDGRIICHCFAGCGIEEICKALDIELSDIMPDELSPGEPYGRHRWHPAAVLRAIHSQLILLAMLAVQVYDGEKLNDEQRALLFGLIAQINEAVDATRR